MHWLHHNWKSKTASFKIGNEKFTVECKCSKWKRLKYLLTLR